MCKREKERWKASVNQWTNKKVIIAINSCIQFEGLSKQNKNSGEIDLIQLIVLIKYKKTIISIISVKKCKQKILITFKNSNISLVVFNIKQRERKVDETN